MDSGDGRQAGRGQQVTDRLPRLRTDHTGHTEAGVYPDVWSMFSVYWALSAQLLRLLYHLFFSAGRSYLDFIPDGFDYGRNVY